MLQFAKIQRFWRIAGLRPANKPRSGLFSRHYCSGRNLFCQLPLSALAFRRGGWYNSEKRREAAAMRRKDREITALTAKIAQLESQNFTTGVVQQAVAPILGQLSALNNEVDDIKCRMPETISVTYPNITAVNNTPYMGNFYGNGFFGNNGFGNGIVF
jgi:hypothetical protein